MEIKIKLEGVDESGQKAIKKIVENDFIPDLISLAGDIKGKNKSLITKKHIEFAFNSMRQMDKTASGLFPQKGVSGLCKKMGIPISGEAIKIATTLLDIVTIEAIHLCMKYTYEIREAEIPEIKDMKFAIRRLISLKGALRHPPKSVKLGDRRVIEIRELRKMFKFYGVQKAVDEGVVVLLQNAITNLALTIIMDSVDLMAYAEKDKVEKGHMEQVLRELGW